MVVVLLPLLLFVCDNGVDENEPHSTKKKMAAEEEGKGGGTCLSFLFSD